MVDPRVLPFGRSAGGRSRHPRVGWLRVLAGRAAGGSPV